MKTWIMPDGQSFSAGDETFALQDALAEAEAMRDDWDAVCVEIGEELQRREDEEVEE